MKIIMPKFILKARGTKYIKRTPKPGGGYNYTYRETGGGKNKRAKIGEKIIGTDIHSGRMVSGTVTAVGKDGVIVDDKYKVFHETVNAKYDDFEDSLGSWASPKGSDFDGKEKEPALIFEPGEKVIWTSWNGKSTGEMEIVEQLDDSYVIMMNSHGEKFREPIIRLTKKDGRRKEHTPITKAIASIRKSLEVL